MVYMGYADVVLVMADVVERAGWGIDILDGRLLWGTMEKREHLVRFAERAQARLGGELEFGAQPESSSTTWHCFSTS